MLRKYAFAAAAVLALQPGSASAFELWLGEYGSAGMQHPLSIGAGALGGWYQRPRINNTVAFTTPTGVTNTAFNVNTSFVGPGGTVGWTFRDGTFPAWAGSRVRLSFSGTYAEGDASRSGTVNTPPTSTVGYTAVDGRFAVFAGIGTGVSAAEAVRVKFNTWELSLRAAADHPLAAGWTLTPSFGIFGGRSIERYNISGNLIVGPFTGFPHNVDERVSTSRIGFDAGATLRWQPAEYVTLFAGGRVGVAHVHSNLAASDCFLFAITTNCTTTPGTFTPNSAFNTSTSDSRSAFGIRAGGQLGMTLTSGWLSGTLAGFFNFDNKVPGVTNPSNTGTVAVGTNVGPARIKFAGDISYGGSFVVKFTLP